MEKNRITTYLLYAIGEIVLVVIGILIAVSLNNWNGKLKSQASRADYLTALRSEFRENKQRLKIVREANQRNIQAARSLSQLMGKDPGVITIDSLHKLIIGVVGYEVQYRPSTGVIDEIIASGKLELFGNDSLRYLLAGWGSELVKVQFQEKEEVHISRLNFMNEILPKMNLKNAIQGFQDNFFNLSKSNLQAQEYEVLSSILVENYVVVFITSNEFLEMRYADLDKKIDEIMSKMDADE